MRKHRQQMTIEEIASIETHVRKLNCEAVSQHAIERMGQKAVNARELANCLKYGEVFEAHNDTGEWRVLLRFAFGKPKVAVCAVFSIERGEVITVWKNVGQNAHRAIDMAQYPAGFNVKTVLEMIHA